MATANDGAPAPSYQPAREAVTVGQLLTRVGLLQLVALGQTGCTLLLLGICAWLLARADPPAYPVLVRLRAGVPELVERYPKPYEPNQMAIMREIEDWLLWVRSVSI